MHYLDLAFPLGFQVSLALNYGLWTSHAWSRSQMHIRAISSYFTSHLNNFIKPQFQSALNTFQYRRVIACFVLCSCFLQSMRFMVIAWSRKHDEVNDPFHLFIYLFILKFRVYMPKLQCGQWCVHGTCVLFMHGWISTRGIAKTSHTHIEPYLKKTLLHTKK